MPAIVVFSGPFDEESPTSSTLSSSNPAETKEPNENINGLVYADLWHPPK